jgi:hypothetical protein
MVETRNRLRRRPLRPLVDNGDGTYSVVLSQGRLAIVDSEDAALVGQYIWSAVKRERGRFYAVTSCKNGGKFQRIYLHRLVLGGNPEVVDHADGDGLNNRRSNLRATTQANNVKNIRRSSLNTSGYKGVHRTKNGRWQAQIKAAGRSRYIGNFDTPEAAHDAYCKAAAELHGEFARTA